MKGSVGRMGGRGAFCAWSLVGALLSFSVVASASVGLFVLPVALGALAIVGIRVRVWPEIVGALEGVAALTLFVGLLNLGSTPCPSTGSGVVRSGSPSSETSCGGFDPLPWLTVGLVLAGAGLVAHVLTRARS